MIYFLKKSTPSKKGLYLQIYVNFYDASTKKKKTLSYKTLGYVSELKEKRQPVLPEYHTFSNVFAQRR